MALDAFIFDLDGTLLDTNAAHVEAWERAFTKHGYRIPRDRIAAEIGKGGDKLLPSVLGEETARTEGKALRDDSASAFRELAAKTRFRAFPGVAELLTRLHEKGLRLVLATSSNKKHLEGTFASADLDVRHFMDELVTADDAEATKPSPDLVQAALAKLDLTPAQAAMLGDTQFDAEACRRAGVACFGLLCGGTGMTAEQLRRAGARAVYRDPADVLAHLDETLALASPGPASLNRSLLEALMREALQAAREGLERGESPIGCVLARGDGTILARGQRAVQQSGNPTAHAVLQAFAAAAGKIPPDARDLLLVTTVEPCVLCTGAAMEARVDVIVYGVQVAADSGTDRVLPPEHARMQMPRIVGHVLEKEARQLLEEARRRGGAPSEIAYLTRLLDAK